jgi:hypothetical protein
MNTTVTEWVRTTEACKRLCVGRTTLWEMRRDNLLKKGVHYRRISNRPKSPLIWDLLAMDSTLRGMTHG